MQQEQLAWAAGFLDGEGSFVRCRRKGKRPGGRLQIQAAQQERHPLDRLEAALGGNVYGPYGPYSTQRKPYFLWILQGEDRVRAAVVLLWPFLSEPKQRQAGRAVDGYGPDNLGTETPSIRV